MFYRKLFFITFFLTFSGLVIAQGKFILNGKVYSKSKEAISNAKINVFINNKTVINIESDGKGAFSIPFELNKEYKIDVSKTDYITKRFIVNTMVPNHNFNENFDLFSLIIIDQGEADEASGIPVSKYYFDELNGGFTGRVYNQLYMPKSSSAGQKQELNLKNQKAVLGQQKKIIAEAEKMLNEAQLIKLEAAKYADSVRNLIYQGLGKKEDNNEIEYKDLINRALENSTQAPTDKDFESFLVNKTKFEGNMEVSNLRKRIKELSIIKNKSSWDSLDLRKNQLELRKKLLEMANYQLEVDRLKSLSKEDSIKIGQREAELFFIQQEMALAGQEIENAKKELLLKDIVIDQKNIILIIILIGAILLLVSLFVVYYYYRDKKRVNKLLKFQNSELEKLSIVAQETSNAVIITDKKGKFTWVNKAYTKLFGYQLDEATGKKAKSLMNSDCDESINRLIQKSLVTGKAVNYELETKTKTGKDIWLQSSITPIVDDNNLVSKMVVVDTDISGIKEAEEEIKQKNKQIISSITYAKNIQTAILPPAKSLDESFENFVIFKPKDIVSGDFYWHSILNRGNGRNETQIVAVVDCTGHGVPGAFMSMIGNRLLNEIVREKEIDEPAQILEMLNNLIISTLRQKESENNDGMDVCICAFEKVGSKTRLIFAGAKRPLIVYKKSTGKITTIKGTRKSVGGKLTTRNKEVFKNNEVYLEKGDIIYLSSDGFIDQPSPNRSRFGTKRLDDTLMKIVDTPLSVQREILEKTLINFQEDEDQRDDITFLAIKL